MSNYREIYEAINKRDAEEIANPRLKLERKLEEALRGLQYATSEVERCREALEKLETPAN